MQLKHTQNAASSGVSRAASDESAFFFQSSVFSNQPQKALVSSCTIIGYMYAVHKPQPYKGNIHD